MSRYVVVEGKRIELTDKVLLGVGGEAEVYRHGERAIKIYHPIDRLVEMNPGVNRRMLEKRIILNREKIGHFPKGLPANVVAPIAPVYQRDKIAGFIMALVAGGYDIRQLARRAFREGTIDNGMVTRIFIHLLETLTQLHRRGVVVGDLNDANVLFRDEQSWIIDADSMQFGQYSCPVATERYLDPKLYGVDLASAPRFTPGSDYFAYAALLLSAWLYVGPYGGRHQQLRTWTRRAEARKSIFANDVHYPKAAVRYDILPDEILDYFERVFEKDLREPLGKNSLLGLEWRRCSHCGLEHARPLCPCQVGKGAVKKASISYRAVKVETILETTGRIITAKLEGKTLRYLYEQDGVIYREDGNQVMQGPLTPGIRFAIAGETTWVGKETQLIGLRDGQTVERTQTNTFENLPMFTTAGSDLIRVDNNQLVHLSSRGRSPMGQVMPNQTWFSAGDDYGFGFYRVGATPFFFLFEKGVAHLREVKLPHFQGRLLDAHCVFDTNAFLVLFSEEVDGKVRNSLTLIRRRDGAVVANLSGSPDDERILASIRGKALRGNAILSATDEGLLLNTINGNGAIREIRRFADTEPFIEQGARLLPVSDNSLYVVTVKEIRRISL